jgi:hypothetical protein
MKSILIVKLNHSPTKNYLVTNYCNYFRNFDLLNILLEILYKKRYWAKKSRGFFQFSIFFTKETLGKLPQCYLSDFLVSGGFRLKLAIDGFPSFQPKATINSLDLNKRVTPDPPLCSSFAPQIPEPIL